MKDATGRTFEAGDYIVYFSRQGSSLNPKFGKVLALQTRKDYRDRICATLLVQGAERGWNSGNYELQSKRSTLMRGDTAVIMRRDQLDSGLVELLDAVKP